MMAMQVIKSIPIAVIGWITTRILKMNSYLVQGTYILHMIIIELVLNTFLVYFFLPEPIGITQVYIS